MNRPTPWRTLGLMSLLGLWIAAGRASGQQPEGPQPPSRPPAETAVQEEGPRVYYLRDENGKYIFVPQFSFEEYQRLVGLKKQMNEPEVPAFVIERLQIEGQLDGEVAVLAVRLEVRIQESSGPAGAWTKIPLRFDNAVLREGVGYEGSGEAFTRKEQGLACWIKSGAGTTHILTARLALAVRRISGETHLAIEGPIANTSQTVMRVPMANAEATVQESSHTVRSTRPLTGGGTEFVVEGSGGDLHIQWREAGDPGNPTPARLNVNSKIRFIISDADSVSCRADLTIRNPGGEFPPFEIRLPPDMEWTPRPSTRFEISPASAPPGTRSPLLRVRPKSATSEDSVLHLEAELKASEASNGERVLDVSGFEVLGAVRQRGQIEFVVPDDWSLVPDEGVAVQRVDLASDPAAPTEVDSRFQFYRQPYGLKVQLKRKQRDIRAEPRFESAFKPKSIELMGTIDYHVRGARTSRFELDSAGWTIEEVGPPELVQSFDVQSDRLVVELRPVNSSFLKLTIAARQEIAEDASRVSLRLPKPTERTVSPARLLVRAAQNIELTPVEDQIRGLVPAPPEEPSSAAPGASQWTYLEDRSADGPRFVADIRQRTRTMSVAVETALTFGGDEVQVHEDLLYDIAFGTADRIGLVVPAGLVSGTQPLLTVSLGGASLEPRLEPQLDARSATGSRVLVEYRLPVAQSGPLKLSVDFTLPMNDDTPGEIPVQLVLPEPNEHTTLDVKPLRIDSGRLQITSGSEGSLGGERRLNLAQPFDPIVLSVTNAGTDQQRSLVVRQAWVQGWLDGASHQFRSTFRVNTNQVDLQIQLPDQAESPIVAINHKHLAAAYATSGGQLPLKIPPEESTGELLVEVWYRMPVQRGWVARTHVLAPRILGATSVGRTYWHLITPRNRHLLWSLTSVTHELSWQWRGAYWERQANRSERDLEDWIGATGHTEPIPADTNQYLFTSVGPTADLEVVTAGRHVIVLAISGTILVAGLALLYLPSLRRASLLFLAGVLLCALAILYPEPVMLVAQAAAVGLVLLVGARLVDVAVTRRHSPAPTVRGRTRALADTKTADLRVVPIDSGAGVTQGASPSIRIAPSHSKS